MRGSVRIWGKRYRYRISSERLVTKGRHTRSMIHHDRKLILISYLVPKIKRASILACAVSLAWESSPWRMVVMPLVDAN